jgi:hypothetical protein
MGEIEADTWSIRWIAGEVRGLGLAVQEGALDTAPALLRAAHALDGAAAGVAASACGEALAATLEDLTNALTALAAGLRRAAEEYDLAERRQTTRFR